MTEASYVVINEHSLGIIRPQQPEIIDVLRALVRKGATWSLNDPLKYISALDVIRPATLADFDEYHVMPPKGFGV